MSQLTISTQEKRFPVAPDLYGLFLKISAMLVTAACIQRCFVIVPLRILCFPMAVSQTIMAKHLLLQQDGLMSSTMARE